MNFFSRWLATLAGARHDVLARTPVDRFRYVAMGGVLLTTSAIAAVSASFALIMAVRVPAVVAVIAGIGWGVVILNLDRLLTISMTRRSGWARNLVSALPRLALAILLGTVISTPLVLRIFQTEIDTELKVLHDQQTASFHQQLTTNPQYAAIPGLEQQLAADQAKADQDPNAVATKDPAVVAAQQKVDTTRTAYQQAQATVQCEIVGNCGTHHVGVGAAAQQDIQARDIALRDYNDAMTALNSAEQQARTAASAASAAAGKDAARIQQDLTQRRQQQATEQDTFNASAANDNGLLARIEALGALGDQRPDLWTTQVVLFLLFLSIEVLPVLVKLLQLAGPQSVYDQLIEKLEESAKRTAAKAVAREEAVADEYGDRQAQLEHEQARLQFEAGLRANEHLVRQQALIAEQAIQQWAAEAQRRSDHEMTTWFHTQGYPNHQPTQPLHTSNGANHPDERTVPLDRDRHRP